MEFLRLKSVGINNYSQAANFLGFENNEFVPAFRLRVLHFCELILILLLGLWGI